MKSTATFGEIMLRLSPPGRERLLQSPSFSVRFGGGEANVAVSLAIFGHRVRHISVCPAHRVGGAAVPQLRGWGVGAEEKMTKVAVVKTRDRKSGIKQAVGLLDLPPMKGKRIFLKPNFNTGDPFPAGTHNDTLPAIIRRKHSRDE